MLEVGIVDVRVESAAESSLGAGPLQVLTALITPMPRKLVACPLLWSLKSCLPNLDPAVH